MGSHSFLELRFNELPDPSKVWLRTAGNHGEGLGRLVLLIEERVRNAALKEIQLGWRVGLNWYLAKMEYPGLGRMPCDHKIVPLLGGLCLYDVYHFNPRKPGCLNLETELTPPQNKAASGTDCGILECHATSVWSPSPKHKISDDLNVSSIVVRRRRKF